MTAMHIGPSGKNESVPVGARRRQRQVRRSGVLAFAIACITACSGGVAGIFFTLATETETGDKNLENELNVSAMTTSGGAYYVGAGSIWVRDVWDWCECAADDDHTWSLLANEFSKPALVTTMVGTTFARNDQLFAGFFFPTGSTPAARHGLFRWTSPGIATTATWNEVSLSAGDDEQIVDVFLVADGSPDGRLAVVTATEDSSGTFEYGLYHSTDGITFAPADFNGSSTLPQRPTAVVFDVTTTNHFVVAGVEVFSGDITATLAESTQAPHIDADIDQPPLGYTGALASAGGWLYVGDRQGHVYTSSDGGTSWTDTVQVTISSTVVQFTSFAQKGTKIFVGTEGYGYFSFVDATAIDGETLEDFLLFRGPEFTTPDLYGGAVTGLTTPSGTPTIFVQTAGVGLWSTEFVGTDVTDWVRE